MELSFIIRLITQHHRDAYHGNVLITVKQNKETISVLELMYAHQVLDKIPE